MQIAIILLIRYFSTIFLCVFIYTSLQKINVYVLSMVDGIKIFNEPNHRNLPNCHVEQMNLYYPKSQPQMESEFPQLYKRVKTEPLRYKNVKIYGSTAVIWPRSNYDKIINHLMVRISGHLILLYFSLILVHPKITKRARSTRSRKW